MDITTILATWESWGIFDTMLPFLLLFAVIFGVLTTTNILGKNKGVHVIIALVIAVLALRVGFVQAFFSEAFPRLGVAIGVILIVVILTALFIPDEHRSGWAIGLYSLGAVAFIFVLFNSFSAVGWFNTNFWEEWGSALIGVLLLVGIIIVVAVSSGDKSDKKSANPATFGPWR